MLQLFRKRLSNRKGFTLVELMVVVAIIGILASIAVPKFNSATDNARGAKMQADLRTIDSAIAIAVANGTYTVGTAAESLPASVTAYLSTTPAPPSATANWRTTTHASDGQTVGATAYGINADGRATVTTTNTNAGTYTSDQL